VGVAAWGAVAVAVALAPVVAEVVGIVEIFAAVAVALAPVVAEVVGIVEIFAAVAVAPIANPDGR